MPITKADPTSSPTQGVPMPNRIADAVANQTRNITARLADGRVSKERLAELHRSLDLSLEEFVRFQELKSVETMNGKLTLEEGQLLYHLLGTTPSVFNGQSLAVKVVLTQVFQELLAHSLRAA